MRWMWARYWCMGSGLQYPPFHSRFILPFTPLCVVLVHRQGDRTIFRVRYHGFGVSTLSLHVHSVSQLRKIIPIQRVHVLCVCLSLLHQFSTLVVVIHHPPSLTAYIHLEQYNDRQILILDQSPHHHHTILDTISPLINRRSQMSSSVASPVQWGGQLPRELPADNASVDGSARRRKKKTPRSSVNGNTEKKKPKSISPVPTTTTSTRSTRSRKNVAYGESDSPELPADESIEEDLESINDADSESRVMPVRKKGDLYRGGISTRMSKSLSSTSVKSELGQSGSLVSPPDIYNKDLPEIGEVIIVDPPSNTASKPITPERESVKADLPPSASTTLKISFKTAPKRLAVSQDVTEDDVSSTYDVTPRISPTPAANGEAEIQGEEAKDAPKRAPRKKRKWLKRGEGE